MNFWGFVCDLFALTPEQEEEYHRMEVEYGFTEPAPLDDVTEYLEHMPVEKDVWYDGEFTGYYQYYRTDRNGYRHYEPEIYSFYSGYTGQIVGELVPVVVGEVVEEYIPVYMRLQGRNY